MTTPPPDAGPRLTPDFVSAILRIRHDPLDPDPGLALFLDPSLPIDEQAKAAAVLDGRSNSRQFLLPVVRPFARLAIVTIQLLRILLPRAFASTKLLHTTIHWGLSRFVSPAANFLILRHMHIGTEITAFLRENIGCSAPTVELRPRNLAALRENVFLQHDLNLYNFVIGMGQELREKGQGVAASRPEGLSFAAITDGPFPIEPLPSGLLNVVDLATAVEVYTPMYQLLLSDADFWRASNSLQLDETIALHVAALLQDASHLGLVNNRHPMIPLSTLRAAHRLMLHGLAAEVLHALLVRYKRASESGSAESGLVPRRGSKDEAPRPG